MLQNKKRTPASIDGNDDEYIYEVLIPVSLSLTLCEQLNLMMIFSTIKSNEREEKKQAAIFLCIIKIVKQQPNSLLYDI